MQNRDLKSPSGNLRASIEKSVRFIAHALTAVGLGRNLSLPAVIFGTTLFALSLTPSLIPRSFPIQALLSGVLAFIGFEIGLILARVWRYLELPRLPDRWSRPAAFATGTICILSCIWFLYHASFWQNSIRELMGLDPTISARPQLVALIAALIFMVLVLITKLLVRFVVFITQLIHGVVPRRVSLFIGSSIAIVFLITVSNGLVLQTLIQMADDAFLQADKFNGAKLPKPSLATKTGSDASLISWDSMGKQGRSYITNGPSADDIGLLTGSGAQQPIRVYAGLRSAESAEERARLALAELIRVGGFDRSTLVISTPTGTGWLDPAGHDTMEFILGGDVATIAMQYSYLASWLSLLTEPKYSGESARALFRKVYAYWRALPVDKRPKLYLHGLSLGTYGSEQSAKLYEIFDQPFDGVLWAGPPFPSQTWSGATADRKPGSPQWLPRFGDGSLVRFTNQTTSPSEQGDQWGKIRIIYLQYASDPIVFFSPSMLFNKPDWMSAPRGPDVSPQFQWYPVISFMQLVVDMMIATTSPIGYGHVYAPEDYIDAWLELTGSSTRSPANVNLLKAHFAKQIEQ